MYITCNANQVYLKCKWNPIFLLSKSWNGNLSVYRTNLQNFWRTFFFIRLRISYVSVKMTNQTNVCKYLHRWAEQVDFFNVLFKYLYSRIIRYWIQILIATLYLLLPSNTNKIFFLSGISVDIDITQFRSETISIKYTNTRLQ